MSTERRSLTVSARLDCVASCAEFVASCAAQADFPAARVREIELIIEELLVNICRYAYGEAPGEVKVNCSQVSARHLLLEVIDQGKPFNILQMPPPELQAQIEHRTVGGLGIPLIRALANRVSYRREGDCNVLCLTLTMGR